MIPETDPDTTLFIGLAAIAAILFYAAARLVRELQMLQQNSYRPERYRRWLKQQSTSGGLNVDGITDILMVCILGGFFRSPWRVYAIVAVGLLCLYKGVRLLRRRRFDKKPLVWTHRVVRIFTAGLTVVAVVCAGVAAPLRMAGFDGIWAEVWLWAGAATALLSVCGMPFVTIAAVWILGPLERAVNRRYIADARRILGEMPGLVVIGITGSYGKTSTKHYLYRILSERFSVLMTPGSFNTTLGVVRTIREQLRPFHQIFIVEMGAKQPGDIAEICDLVRPSVGIVTAVGEQHLESFGSIENVQKTKFELIDALPADGVAILNNDFEMIANRPVGNVERVFRYSATGPKPGNDGAAASSASAGFHLTGITYGPTETTFRVATPEGTETEPFATRLVGVHNLSNVLAGYIAGRTLGITDGEIRYAVGQIEQVEHRLSIKRLPGNVTIIDDAFNSNPHGAAMALDVLAQMGRNVGNDFKDSDRSGSEQESRRIVVTPGMIELGEKQHLYNRELGRKMASACDFVIVVGEYNREAIVTGLADGGFPKDNITTAATFPDAVERVRELTKPGVIVLYENDLPDTFK